MNDSNNFPNNNNKLPTGWGNFNNGKLPEKWGIFNHSNMRSSPWENTPKTTAWGNTNNNSENSHSKPKSVNTKNVNEVINKFADMAKRAGEKTANKISGLQNKENSSGENISAADEYAVDDNSNVSSDETVYKDDKDAFVKSVPTTDKTNAVKSNAKSFAETSERLNALKLPQISSISKENPEIKIPESEKENLDYVIEKYIKTAGYQPSWKFKSYCGEKLNLESGSAVKKYRIKVFTFYMRDLLTVIAELYKFDYVKIYEALQIYQNFFIDETGNLDIALLMKASSPIVNRMISGGLLTSSGEGFDTLFRSTVVEKPVEEELLPIKEKTKVKPQTETVKQEEQATSRGEIPLHQNEFYEPVKEEKTFQPVPVNRNIQRKDTIPIFHDEESQAVYNSYYDEPKSHNKVIIITVIILLVPVIIMCGLKLVDYYQKNHSDNFSAVSSEVSQTSEMTETTAITATETVKSTVAESQNPTIAVETTETVLTQSIMPEKKVSVIPVDNISGYPQYEDILRTYTSDERCMLCDLNNDGTAELVITNAGNSILMIYTILNNEAVWLIDATGNVSRGAAICENGAIVHGFSSGAYHGEVYKQYIGGDSLDDIEYILYDENGIHYNVKTNAGEITTDITEIQAEEIQNKYKGMYLETVPISSLGLSGFPSEEINLSYVMDYVELGMTVDEVMSSTGLTTDKFNIKYGNTSDIYGNQTLKTIYFLTFSTFKIPNADMSDMPAVLFFEFTDSGILYNYGYHIGTDDLNIYQYSLNELKEQYSKIYDYLKEIYGQGEPVYYSNSGIDTGYQWMLTDYRNIWLVVGENMWGDIGVTDITFSISDPSLL